MAGSTAAEGRFDKVRLDRGSRAASPEMEDLAQPHPFPLPMLGMRARIRPRTGDV